VGECAALLTLGGKFGLDSSNAPHQIQSVYTL
jgi:hypothetical protein